MEDPRDRLIRYIDDARAAEKGAVELFDSFVKEAKNEEARQALQDALMMTKEHELQMERRLRELGGQPSASKGFFNQMLGKLADLMHAAHDDYDKTTQDVIKAYAASHLGVGMYAALATYAKAYGDLETSQLAEKIMAEEQQAADRFRPLVATCAAPTFTASMQKAA